MNQDNQDKKVQFCRELGAVVNSILRSSNDLLSIIEKLLHLYRPKSQEEAGEFYTLRFDLPDFAGLLCGLRIIKMPDDDEFYDSVGPLREMAVDVASRMVCADVIIIDIINMYVEPHDDDLFIHLYLAILKDRSKSIRYMSEKLEELFKEISLEWPEMSMLDDDMDMDKEESILPGEVESFLMMKNALIEALTKYTDKHKSAPISDFLVAIQNYLENFENGVEPDEEFDFGFNLVTGYHENNCIDFCFESRVIQISSGGSVYNADVGGDSYNNWMYSIGLNGWDDYTHSCDFSVALELVCSGAELIINSPEEYIVGEDE